VHRLGQEGEERRLRKRRRARPADANREPDEAQHENRDADRLVELIGGELRQPLQFLKAPAQRELEEKQQRENPVQGDRHARIAAHIA